MEWVSKWQMSFQFKVMYVAAQNLYYYYKLMESEITVTDKERDFVIMINS